MKRPATASTLAARSARVDAIDAMPGLDRAIAGNRLLCGLPEADRRRLLAEGEHVALAADDLLYQAGARLRHVYFPLGCVISLVTPLASSAGLEVALVGNEGMTGVALLLGVPSSPLNHLVHGAGDAWRMGAPSFRRALRRSPSLRRRLNWYAYVKMQQIAQTVACTRYHPVEQRLARWLLMTRDRARSDRFHATHELLGYMLGVRRVGITKAASALQSRGLIRYSRGNVVVLDRPGLLSSSCGCYAAATDLYDSILGPASASGCAA